MFSFLKAPVSAPLITDKREVDASTATGGGIF